MESNASEILFFAGSSHRALAEEIVQHLDIPLGKVMLERFPDGEISLQILENVRGRDVYVLQTVALDPNNYLMELLIMIDALKRASAKSIVVVIPYFGYCRQDRKDKPRVPITAKLVANLLVSAGATRILTMDLHASQLQGFFDIPVDNLHGRQCLIEAFKQYNPQNIVVVSPDIGSVKLGRLYATKLGADFAIIDKQRASSTEIEAVTLIGDVKDKDVLLADDMCSTGGTLVSAAKACQEKGAKRIFAAVTHGILVGDAIEKIENSPIEALLVSSTIPCENRIPHSTKIHVISVGPFFSKAIDCLIAQESISLLDDL